MYNHSDSYPSGLGKETVEFIRRRGMTDVRIMKIAEGIVMFDSKVKPTEAQKQLCRDAKTIDLRVSEQSEDDWYCLLRNAQGDLAMLEKVPFMEKGWEVFLADSISCQYAYILNLDEGVLEVYCGSNKRGDRKGRYARLREREEGELSEYRGVALVGNFTFDWLRKHSADEAVKEIERLCRGIMGELEEEDEGKPSSALKSKMLADTFLPEEFGRKTVAGKAARKARTSVVADAVVDKILGE